MPIEDLGAVVPKFEDLGPADLPPSITGPLIGTPREVRRRRIAAFDADTNPVSASEFGRGVSKGFLDIGTGALGFGEALSDLMGADSAKAWLKEKGDRLDEINANIPLAIENFTEIQKAGDIPAYVFATIGKLAPQIVGSVGAGMAVKAATKLGPVAAGALGSFATSYPQEAGGMYRGIREETGKEAPATALAFGAPSAALDAFTPTRFLGKVFGGAAGDEIKKRGWRALVKETFKEAVKSGLIESTTETAQEAIAVSANRFADATYPLLTEKNAIRLIDAGLQGLIGGTVIGGSEPSIERLAKGGQIPARKVSTLPRQETGGIDDTPPKLVQEITVTPKLAPPATLGTTQEPNATQQIVQQQGAVSQPAGDVQQLPQEGPQERAPVLDRSQLLSPAAEPQQAPTVTAQAPPLERIQTVQPPAEPAKGPAGARWQAQTPMGEATVSGVWRVSSANDLVTSFDQGYDPMLQPRDRSRIASQEQIARIATALDVNRLGDSATTNLGAPLSDSRGQVLSGNGRVTAIRALYDAKGAAADEYRSFVTRRASELGIDPETVAAIPNPVLHREIVDFGGTDPVILSNLSNQSDVMGMSSGEKAISDARMLERLPALLNLFRPSETGEVLASSNREFLNAFIQATGDRAELLSADGYNGPKLNQRVRSAMAGLLVGADDSKLMRSLVEDADDAGIKRVADAVIASAPTLTRLKGSAYDLGPALAQALRDLVRIRQSGEKIEDFLGQTSLFADPHRSFLSDTLLRLMHSAKSVPALLGVFQRYNALAREAIADQSSGGLFGGDTPRTREQLLQAVHERTTQTQSAGQADFSFRKPQTVQATTPVTGSPSPESGQPKGTPGVGPGKTIFDPGGETLGTAPTAPTFYSRLQRTVEQSPQQKASGAQWKGTIKNSKLGVNTDEFEMVGVDNLEDAKPYTKQEVLDFLKANEIQVKEMTLGGATPEQEAARAEFKMLDKENQTDADAARMMKLQDEFREKHGYGVFDTRPRTHYSQYQLGGGEPGTYREWVVHTQPSMAATAPHESPRIERRLREILDASREPNGRAADANRVYTENPEYRELRDRLDVAAKEDARRTGFDWRDGHEAYADIPNPIVRLRGAVHTTTDGKKMLLLEEVQAPTKDNFKKMPALFQAKWRDIAFKFALRKAAELGVDQLGWTTGRQQADRYDLRKQVDSIMLNQKPNGKWLIETRRPGNRGYIGIATDVETGKLESYIGKDLARKVAENPQSTHEFSGPDLEIGGAGLAKLYDVDFRNTVQSLPIVKKAGEKVETAVIGRQLPLQSWFEIPSADEPTGFHTVHAIAITPEMRAAAMQGQSLAFPPSSTVTPTQQPTRTATTLDEALSILHDPASGIDPTVSRALISALSTPGLAKAAAAAGFGFDLVSATNALLGGSAARFDPVTRTMMLAYNATDPLTGPHEVAHSLEQFLSPERKAFVRKERSAAIDKALKRSNLTQTQREFLQQIGTQERTSDWFRAQFEQHGTQLLEFYPLINGSEFFAQSFSTWFNRKHDTSTAYRTFMDAIKAFLTKIYDALRRQFGSQGAMEAIHRSLVNGDFSVTMDTGTILGTQDPLAAMPQFWTNRQKADEAMSLRGIPPARLAEAQQLANVQGGMVPDATAYEIDQLQPGNTPEGYAKRKLKFISDLRDVAQSPAHLATVPHGTPEEQRVATVAGNQLLGHHGIITQNRDVIRAEAADKQVELTNVVNKELPKANRNNLKAGFLQQLAARLLRDYTAHIDNEARTLSSSQNYDAAADTAIRRLQDRVNDQTRNPAGLEMALEKIADAIPDTMLTPNVSSLDIANWVAGNQPLRATLGQANNNFLIYQNMGYSPLANYPQLRERLATIKRIKADGQAAEAAITTFRNWFQQLHAGGRHASPLAVAKAYAKFREQQRLASDIATGIEDRIDKLDREVRGSLQAGDILDRMMVSPEYLANVTLASNYADFVVTDMLSTGGTGEKRYVGPVTQTVYKVDLTPGKAQETENIQQLTRFKDEIDQYIAQPDSDPVLARSYEKLGTYIKQHLLDPAFSPDVSTLTRWWSIGPFKNKIPMGWLTGGVNAAFRAMHFSMQTPQALLERIGGRAGRLANHEFQLEGFVTTKFRGINEHPDHGVHAQNIKNYKAAAAHGYPTTPFGVRKWQDTVIEPLFASHQNDLDIPLKIGDKTPTGQIITALDMEAAQAMKDFENAVIATVQNTEPGGHTVQAYNPVRIADEVGGRAGTRKAIAHGDMVMARHFHNWGRVWTRLWTDADTPAKKLALLQNEPDFVEAALRRVQETNPEYHGQSTDQTQQEIYRGLAYEMKKQGLVFQNIGQLLNRIANDRFQALAPHQNTSLSQQRQIAEDVLLADISSDVTAFNRQVEEIEPWTKLSGKPATIAEITSANNSFTQKRVALVAPSSYYQYGIASDAAKLRFEHGARQIFQLRQIAAMRELKKVLEAKRDEWKKRVDDMMLAGVPRREALKTVKEQTQQAVDQGDFMANWSDLNDILNDLGATLGDLERITQQNAEKYYSETLGFVMALQGTLASQLLSGTSSIIANTSGATNVTTALHDAHLGNWNPVFMAKSALRRSGRVAATALSGLANSNNRAISRVLRRHGPALQGLANSIDQFADLWKEGRMADERIGAFAPYQFKQRMDLQSVFKSTGGRMEFEDPSGPIKAFNYASSLPVMRQFLEAIKATMPRATDQLANIANTKEVESMIKRLEDISVKVWSAREATGNPNWRDTSTKAGLLSNAELGFKESRAARYYRDMFSSIEQLEPLTLRYYEAQKTDPDAKLLTSGQEDTLLLEYLKSTNLATEGNRPMSTKGSQARTLLGLFRGWGGWMWQQIDKLFLQHRGDEKNWLPAISAIVMFMFLAAIVGTVNRELSYSLKEVLTKETSKDIRFPAAFETGDAKDLMRYAALAFANTLPYFGDAANRLLGGTSSRPVMDATAVLPIAGVVQSAFDTASRIATTGDPFYPTVDFFRRWSPALQPVLNRLPVIEGDIAQRNALRAMQAAVPPGMEVREMGSGGNFRGTPMTPILRDIVSAAYTGDETRMNEAIARGIAMKESQGALDGASELAQNLKGYMPARRLFGRDVTATEESRLLGRMTERQQSAYGQSKQAFSLIDSTLARMKTTRSRATGRSGRRSRVGLGRSRLGRSRSGLLGSRRRGRRLRL